MQVDELVRLSYRRRPKMTAAHILRFPWLGSSLVESLHAKTVFQDHQWQYSRELKFNNHQCYGERHRMFRSRGCLGGAVAQLEVPVAETCINYVLIPQTDGHLERYEVASHQRTYHGTER